MHLRLASLPFCEESYVQPRLIPIRVLTEMHMLALIITKTRAGRSYYNWHTGGTITHDRAEPNVASRIMGL